MLFGGDGSPATAILTLRGLAAATVIRRCGHLCYQARNPFFAQLHAAAMGPVSALSCETVSSADWSDEASWTAATIGLSDSHKSAGRLVSALYIGTFWSTGGRRRGVKKSMKLDWPGRLDCDL